MSVCPLFILIRIIALPLVLSLKLPNYITPCSQNDPKLNECMVKNGQAAIPRIIKGDPRYRAPVMDPWEIAELQVDQGTSQVGLKLALRNAKIYGLSHSRFLKSKTDLKKRHLEWFFRLPRMEINADYDISGRILILPITGSGKANITLTKLETKYTCDWDLIDRKGTEYINFTSSEIDFKTGQTYFDLKNLFNGDVFLGENMNRFLNENWREVTKELGPAVGQAFSDVFRLLLSRIASLVPYHHIFVKA